MIALVWLAIVSSVNAQESTWDGQRLSRHENPNYVSDRFSEYINSYNNAVNSNADDVNPYDQVRDGMFNEAKANEMANIHWNDSISNEQFNQVLLTALGLYNQSLEAKKPVLAYLDKLSTLYADDAREREQTNVATRLTTNYETAAGVWLGLIAATSIFKIVKNRRIVPKSSNMKPVYSRLSTAWRSLVPTNSKRAKALDNIVAYKRWQFTLAVGSSTLAAATSEGFELLSTAIKGPRLDPRPLASMALAYDAKNLGKMSCDINRQLKNNNLEDEPSETQNLIVHLKQTHSFLNEYNRRFNITHNPITPQLTEKISEEDKKLPGIENILFEGVDVHPECDKDNVNLTIALRDLEQAEVLLEQRMN